MHSALGRVQLGKLICNNERRAQLTVLYRELLAELVPELQIPFCETREREASCYHIMPVLLPVGVDRSQFMEGMKAEGIQTSIHYPPVHQFQIYRQAGLQRKGSLTVTEEAAAREVTLPLYPTMQDEQVEWVVQAVRRILGELK